MLHMLRLTLLTTVEQLTVTLTRAT